MKAVRKTVDARGISSPGPWLLTREALLDQHCSEVLAIVDSMAAIQEITRGIKNLPCSTTVKEQYGQYHINIQKGEMADELQLASAENGQTVLIISSTSLGRGEDHLGSQLMSSFIYSLMQLEGFLKTVIFINSGVFLTTEGSEVLAHLQHMEERGIGIVSSHTCLSYYNLLDKLRVGSDCTMFAITEKIAEAQRLIAF